MYLFTRNYKKNKIVIYVINKTTFEKSDRRSLLSYNKNIDKTNTIKIIYR